MSPNSDLPTPIVQIAFGIVMLIPVTAAALIARWAASTPDHNRTVASVVIVFVVQLPTTAAFAWWDAGDARRRFSFPKLVALLSVNWTLLAYPLTVVYIWRNLGVLAAACVLEMIAVLATHYIRQWRLRGIAGHGERGEH